MTIPIFPKLPGIAWGQTHSLEWSSTVQKARSGKRTAIGNYTYPIHHWSIPYELLRSTLANSELQQMMAFFNQAGAQVGEWLFQDPDDCTVTGQQIGEGNGSAASFQLVRSFGGFVEPFWAPQVVSNVTVGGAPVTGWSVAPFGSANPGMLTLAAAPAPGVAVACDFSFYYVCAFETDQIEFKKILTGMYSADKIPFATTK